MIILEIFASVLFTSILGVIYDRLYMFKDPMMIRLYLTKNKLIILFLFFRSILIFFDSIRHLKGNKQSVENFLTQGIFMGSVFFLIHYSVNSEFEVGLFNISNGVYIIAGGALLLWVIIFSYLATATTFLIDYSLARKNIETHPNTINEYLKSSTILEKIKTLFFYLPSSVFYWQVYFMTALTTIYVLIVSSILK